ncbi:DUF349 domain-containing protein [Corynebacterium mendelii]
MTNRPIPTPGPRPGPRPGHTPARPVAPAAPVHRSDPSKWGRVEDNGEVFGTGPDGQEMHVGSWQAGTPAEGLAHYGVRFDDLATEVELMVTRLSTHPEEAGSIKKAATQLKQSLPTQTVIGDLPSLDKKLDTIITDCDAAGEQVKKQREQRRAAAIARKEELAAEAEQLAENSTEWKAAGDRIKEILAEWKTIKGIDRKTDDKLWKRYAAARDNFDRRRGSHFAELDRTRQAAKRAKEAIIAKAEAIKDSTDWKETARDFRDLMKEWKAAGRAPRDVDDKLWEQFRSAQDHFFNARNAVSEERDKEFIDNAAKKDALIEQYSPLIDPDKDLDTARIKLRELQDKWEEVGFVPRSRIKEFDNKIGELEQRVAKAADELWRRTDPEAQARVAQFTAKVAEFTRQAEEAEAKGNAQKAKKAREQAAQWQEWADTAQNAIDGR